MNAWKEPDAITYRYAVKTDRAAFLKIEKAARASGLSTNTFVQQAFERGLALMPAPKAMRETVSRSDVETSESLGIPVPALRMYRAMRDHRDRQGKVDRPIEVLANAAGVERHRAGVLIRVLMAASLVRLLKRGGIHGPSVYHIEEIGVDA